jgi:hypothetical protein
MPDEHQAGMRRAARRVLAVMFAGAAVLPATNDAVAQATIPVVQARPDTGSRVRRELARITIPATGPYAALTPQQRAEFRAQFASLADADDPPYPVDGLLPIAQDLARGIADSGKVAHGTLFITVLVDASGDGRSTKVYDTPDARVSRAAAEALMKAKYRPALCSGKPCESEFPFTARLDPPG